MMKSVDGMVVGDVVATAVVVADRFGFRVGTDLGEIIN